MAKTTLNPTTMATPRSSYSQVAIAGPGRLVFLAGQTALDNQSRVMGIGDIRAQTKAAFENIRRGVEAAGGRLDDVVSLMIFTTDVRYNGEISDVRGEIFGANFPAGTILQVVALARPELLVEITATAVIS
jgi:2-iminobutanoate/2-iminopropanoate deaminase